MPADNTGLPSRRRLLGYLGLTAAVAAPIAGCTGGAGVSGRVPKAASAPIDVRRFGAKGDGSTDDTRAIERAFSAIDPGQTLLFPSKHVFCHSSTLKLSTPRTRLLGPGKLLATNEENSALFLDAGFIKIDDLTISLASTTRRWDAAEQQKLHLGPHAGFILTDLRIAGSAAAGLYSYGATDFRFTRLRVTDTRADGVHLTNGTRRGTVTAPYVSRSGDDGVAVVSYLQDPEQCREITVDRPVVRTTTGGRGLSVVGGHDVAYRDIDVSRSSAASVYIACEGGDFVTHPTRRVSITGGRITQANTDASIDHGAVLVYSGRAGGDVSDVTVSDVAVTATRDGASRQIGVVADNAEDKVARVVFRDLRLDAAPRPYQGNAPVSAVALSDVTAAGRAIRMPT